MKCKICSLEMFFFVTCTVNLQVCWATHSNLLLTNCKSVWPAALVFFCFFFSQSTYCNAILQHCENVQRSVHVVNLDPAAEHFDYQVLAGVCNYAMHGLFTIKSAFKIIVTENSL